MDQNKIIKTSYHLFATMFLIYLAFNFDNIVIQLIILSLAIIHFYDTYWFLNCQGDAPI
jgi:hypothetical protein